MQSCILNKSSWREDKTIQFYVDPRCNPFFNSYNIYSCCVKVLYGRELYGKVLQIFIHTDQYFKSAIPVKIVFFVFFQMSFYMVVLILFNCVFCFYLIYLLLCLCLFVFQSTGSNHLL